MSSHTFWTMAATDVLDPGRYRQGSGVAGAPQQYARTLIVADSFLVAILFRGDLDVSSHEIFSSY